MTLYGTIDQVLVAVLGPSEITPFLSENTPFVSDPGSPLRKWRVTCSAAFATSGSQQTGFAVVVGTSRASLWSGTAVSWVDLHAFLPPEFSSSEAYGISNDGSNIYVSGSGFNTATGRYEALLWTQAVPEPGTAGLLYLGTILLAMQRRRKSGLTRPRAFKSFA